MEKFKYLLIFTLTLLCMILSYEFYQYKQISNELIFQNNKLDNQVTKLQNQTKKDKNTIQRLNDQIAEQNERSLELERLNRQLLMNYTQPSVDVDIEDENETDFLNQEQETIIDDFQNESETLEKNKYFQEQERSMFELPIDPSVGINEDNKIDSMEFQIQKQF